MAVAVAVAVAAYTKGENNSEDNLEQLRGGGGGGGGGRGTHGRNDNEPAGGQKPRGLVVPFGGPPMRNVRRRVAITKADCAYICYDDGRRTGGRQGGDNNKVPSPVHRRPGRPREQKTSSVRAEDTIASCTTTAILTQSVRASPATLSIEVHLYR